MNSQIELRRFKHFYEEKFNEKLGLSDEQIAHVIKTIGMEFDGKIYEPSSLLDDEAKDNILGYILKLFDSGVNTIYYESIFDHFSSEFQGTSIYSSDMLQAVIASWNDNRLRTQKQYITAATNSEGDSVEDLRACLKTCGRPVVIEYFGTHLPNIPMGKIRQLLGTHSEFIYAGRGQYIHIDCVNISPSDLNKIAAIIEEQINVKRFIAGNELMDSIHRMYPTIYENNPELSDLGTRQAIAYYMRDQFSFIGNIISRTGDKLSMAGVFEGYCKSRGRITLSELNVFKDEVGSVIYFDSVYACKLRVNQDLFIDFSECDFDVPKTDEALGRFVYSDYLPIQAIKQFSLLPGVVYPWNEYLLESYVYSFSKRYKLLHTGFNANMCVGAIIKRSTDYEDFTQVLIDALAKSEVLLSKDEALQYLCTVGLIARRRLSNIDQILKEAAERRKQV